MKIKITQNYILQEDRGVLLNTGGLGTILVTEDTEPDPVEIDTFEETAQYISKRNLKPIEQLQVLTEAGDVDTQATEQAIQNHYSDHYALLNGLAIPFEPGMAVERGQVNPVSFGDKLYNVIQSHITQSDWTPDVTTALFAEIVAPTPGLDCPEFVQPTSTQYYNTGDCVAYNGYYYESLIDVNTWSPDEYPQGWEQIGPV